MTHILTSRGRNKRMRGDRGGDNTFRVTGFVGWSNGVFHVVEFGVLLVSTRKARTYRDQPAVPSLSTFARKCISESGQIWQGTQHHGLRSDTTGLQSFARDVADSMPYCERYRGWVPGMLRSWTFHIFFRVWVTGVYRTRDRSVFTIFFGWPWRPRDNTEVRLPPGHRSRVCGLWQVVIPRINSIALNEYLSLP